MHFAITKQPWPINGVNETQTVTILNEIVLFYFSRSIEKISHLHEIQIFSIIPKWVIINVLYLDVNGSNNFITFINNTFTDDVTKCKSLNSSKIGICVLEYYYAFILALSKGTGMKRFFLNSPFVKDVIITFFFYLCRNQILWATIYLL